MTIDEARFNQWQALVRQVFLPLPPGVEMVFDVRRVKARDLFGNDLGVKTDRFVLRLIAPDQSTLYTCDDSADAKFDWQIRHVSQAFGDFAKAWLVYCQKNAGWGEPPV